MFSKTLTIFLLGLLLAVAAHGEPRLVDHEDAAPEPARLLKGSKGGKSSKGKGGSRLLKASKSKSGKSGSDRYLKGSKSGKGKGSGKGSGDDDDDDDDDGGRYLKGSKSGKSCKGTGKGCRE